MSLAIVTAFGDKATSLAGEDGMIEQDSKLLTDGSDYPNWG